MISTSGPAAISFFATGIGQSVGGIQSANRNVELALEALAAETGARLMRHILHEPAARAGDTIRYGGRRGPMAIAIVSALLTQRLAVFDHVDLARPLAAVSVLPRPVRAETVIFAHGSESWKRMKPISPRVFRAASLVLTNSNYTLANMRKVFSGFVGAACPLGLPPHVALTPAPPDRAAIRPTLTAADGSMRPLGARAMLLVGRMDAREREKGHRELIEVLPTVREIVPEAELVLVGGGSDLAALTSLAAASPAASHVFLPGPVDDDLLATLYSAAYAYVMPSRQEGFGLVFLEAMNHALPCIACDGDGAADVVVNFETGLLLRKPIDRCELNAAILALLTDPARARAYGEAGWRRLHDHFTSHAHQGRILAALRPLT